MKIYAGFEGRFGVIYTSVFQRKVYLRYLIYSIIAPFGRRGWKMVYARLRGMVLYLHKDENGFRHGRFQTFNNAILLHHALAEKPEDYSKRQHVFKLRTANLGETLFQTR